MILDREKDTSFIWQLINLLFAHLNLCSLPDWGRCESLPGLGIVLQDLLRKSWLWDTECLGCLKCSIFSNVWIFIFIFACLNSSNTSRVLTVFYVSVVQLFIQCLIFSNYLFSVSKVSTVPAVPGISCSSMFLGFEVSLLSHGSKITVDNVVSAVSMLSQLSERHTCF